MFDSLGWTEEEIKETLASLIEKGLVQVDNSGPEPLYSLTEHGRIVANYEMYDINPN